MASKDCASYTAAVHYYFELPQTQLSWCIWCAAVAKAQAGLSSLTDGKPLSTDTSLPLELPEEDRLQIDSTGDRRLPLGLEAPITMLNKVT